MLRLEERGSTVGKAGCRYARNPSGPESINNESINQATTTDTKWVKAPGKPGHQFK